MTTDRASIRVAAWALLAPLLCGCIGPKNRSEIPSAGVRVGDTFALASDAAIYACDPGDTAAEFWFGSAREKHCLKARGDVTRYDKLLTPVAAGPQVRVTGAKHINGVDSLIDIAYLDVEGVAERLIAYDFDLPGLTGKADGAPAASDQGAIHGIWLANSESQNGRIWTVDFRYVFSGDMLAFTDETGKVMRYTFTLDTTGNPRLILLRPEGQADAAPVAVAYELDGDVLKIVVAPPGLRPIDISDRNDQELIISRRSRH